MATIVRQTSGRPSAFASAAAAERAEHWARAALLGDAKSASWCRANGVIIERDHSEGSNSAGGFLVPDEMATAVIDLRERYGAFRANADVIPMGREVLDVPKRGSGVTAYWGSEGITITASSFSVQSVGMTAKKLVALVPASSELEEDSAFPLAEFVAYEIARAFALKEDEAGFNGDGGSTYNGIVGVCPKIIDGAHDAGKVVAASGHDTMAEIDASDLGKVIAALPAYAVPDAAWYCSQVVFGLTLCRLAGASGGIVMMPDRQGRYRPHFMGFPIELVPVMLAPAAATTDVSGQVMLLFGDLRRAASFGDRRQLTMGRAANGPTFAADTVLFRGTERLDINVHGLGDNTTAGAIVGLVGE